MSTNEDSAEEEEEIDVPTAVPITKDGPSTSKAQPVQPEQKVEDEYAYDSSDEEVCTPVHRFTNQTFPLKNFYVSGFEEYCRQHSNELVQ